MEKLIQEHGARLYALCLKLEKNTWEAQELYQETWLKAMRGIQKYDDNRPFAPWIARICVNCYRDTLRKRKLSALLGFEDARDAPSYQPNFPAEQAHVRQAVDALPQAYKLVTLLYYFNEQSIAQTAAALNIPQGSVKSRLSKARALLKEALKDE